MVEGGIVLLHGVVDNAMDGDDLETAALRVAGVEGVESYLHIGHACCPRHPHLPVDLRMHLSPPRRRGRRVVRHRTVEEFVRAVASAVPGLTGDQARLVVGSVLGALRELVPEERADIAAVLPPELREFWEHAVPQ